MGCSDVKSSSTVSRRGTVHSACAQAFRCVRLTWRPAVRGQREWVTGGGSRVFRDAARG